jgi:hypothetical protein
MTINMNDKDEVYSHHDFQKSSLVTEKGGFDYYTCEECGIKAKRFGISESLVLVRPNKKKIARCTHTYSINIEPLLQETMKKDIVSTGQKVKVIEDVHLGGFDANNGDILSVVKAPIGEKESDRGYWVQGKNDVFLLLKDEFEKIAL